MNNEFETDHSKNAADEANPYLAPAGTEFVDAVKVDPAVALKPRIWSVFVVFFGSFLLMIAFSVVGVLLFILPAILENPAGPFTPDDFVEMFSTPLGFFAQAFPAQLAIFVAVIAAALCSPVEWKERLGLRDSGLSTFEWLATGFASIVPAALGMGLAAAMSLVIDPDESIEKLYEFEKLYESMTLGFAVPFVLFIALAPGFAEEMMFRGYMQTRLLQRWSPALTIFVSSLLFALLHIMPHAVVFAFPIGVFFGYVAWKTGSIWPTILGHALINGLWNILNISAALTGYSETTYYVLCGVLVAAGIVGMVISWPAIHKLKK